MGEPRGRVALVTGAAGTLGRAIADALAHEGAAIAAVDRKAPAASAIRRWKSEGVPVHFAAADLDDAPRAAGALAECIEALGPIDIFVHASDASFDPASRTRPSAVHLDTGFYFMRALVPAQRVRGWGRVIFIDRLDGRLETDRANDSTARSGAHAHLRVAARELGEHGILLHTIGCRTGMRASSSKHPGRTLSIASKDLVAAETAAQVVRLCTNVCGRTNAVVHPATRMREAALSEA